MDAIEKLSRFELMNGFPKLIFEKDHICDVCPIGK